MDDEPEQSLILAFIGCRDMIRYTNCCIFDKNLLEGHF